VIEKLKEDRKLLSEHIKDTIGYARCYIDGNTLRVEELQSDIFDKAKDIPSSVKNKYQNWAKMLIIGLEHFAASTGIRKIMITTSELQIRKWSNYAGLRGVTAYEAYTKVPMEMGYRLKKTQLQYAETTGWGMNMGDIRHNVTEGSPKQFSKMMWIKNISKKDAKRYEELLYVSDTDREIWNRCRGIEPVEENEDQGDRKLVSYCWGREVELFEDED